MGKVKNLAIEAQEYGTDITGMSVSEVFKLLQDMIDSAEETEEFTEYVRRTKPTTGIKSELDDCIARPRVSNRELQDMEPSIVSYGLPSEFIEFIYGNNIANRFFSNMGIDSEKDKSFEYVTPRNILYSAFGWYDSPEGSNFWVDINAKWQKICEASETTTSDEPVEFWEDDGDDYDIPEEFERYDRYNTPTDSEEYSEQSELDSLLDSRSIYGSFKDKAEWIQGGKQAMRDAPKWEYIGTAEREALDNIMQKMGRILYGEFHEDNWADIAGYATLVVRND